MVALYAFWIAMLLCQQLYLVGWLGITTNEQMNANRYAYMRVMEEQTKQHQHDSCWQRLVSAYQAFGCCGAKMQQKQGFDRGSCRLNLADALLVNCPPLCKKSNVDWMHVYSAEDARAALLGSSQSKVGLV